DLRRRLDSPQVQDLGLEGHADGRQHRGTPGRSRMASPRPHGVLCLRHREAGEPRGQGRDREGLRPGEEDRGGADVAAGQGRRRGARGHTGRPAIQVPQIRMTTPRPMSTSAGPHGPRRGPLRGPWTRAGLGAARRSARQSMRLALFDLDHTLIPFDSGMAWTRFLIEHGALEPGFEAVYLALCEQYVAGAIGIDALHRVSVAPLAGHPRAVLSRWA